MARPNVTRNLAYTLDETARLLGVSRATVNRIVRRGELRVARIGHRTVRVTKEAIRDFLRGRERTGPMSRYGRKAAGPPDAVASDRVRKLASGWRP